MLCCLLSCKKEHYLTQAFMFCCDHFQRHHPAGIIPSHHGASRAHGRSRPDGSSRPSASQGGPRAGYGEGRGQYYAPKGKGK